MADEDDDGVTKKRGRPKGKNRGGRPRKSDQDRLGVQLALRIDPGLLRRLDAHVARLKVTSPKVSWSRGAAIRELMQSALGGVERTTGAPGLDSRVLRVVADWDHGSGRRCPISEVRRRLPTDARAEVDRALIALERSGSIDLDRPRAMAELASLTAQDKAGAISDPVRGLLHFASVRRG